MPPNLTDSKIAQLTSDTATIKDGRKLATPARWSSMGSAGQIVWGACQGSAKDPYRVCLDAGEIGYKCTCPSKKFPCKHVMGLALLAAEQPALFVDSALPDYVKSWQANRQSRHKREPDKAPDSAAQAERAEARERKVAGGMDELRLWLRDLVRRGLTDDRVRTYEFWDRIAARMVDAQAPGVGRRLRGLAGIPMQGKPDWADRLLDEVSSLYLLADSYPRIDTLPPATRDDIRALIGWTVKQDELLAQPGLADVWWVMGQIIETEDRMHTRRVWLHGARSGRKALILDFAHGSAKFDEHYGTGTAFAGELVYYPGAVPLRAAVKKRIPPRTNETQEPLSGFDCADVAQALDRYADALARNVWVGVLPLGFRGVRLYQAQGRALLRDASDNVLPVTPRANAWFFAAVGGNRPLPVFGEWDGYEFSPRTLIADGQFCPC